MSVPPLRTVFDSLMMFSRSLLFPTSNETQTELRPTAAVIGIVGRVTGESVPASGADTPHVKHQLTTTTRKSSAYLLNITCTHIIKQDTHLLLKTFCSRSESWPWLLSFPSVSGNAASPGREPLCTGKRSRVEKGNYTLRCEWTSIKFNLQLQKCICSDPGNGIPHSPTAQSDVSPAPHLCLESATWLFLLPILFIPIQAFDSTFKSWPQVMQVQHFLLFSPALHEHMSCYAYLCLVMNFAHSFSPRNLANGAELLEHQGNRSNSNDLQLLKWTRTLSILAASTNETAC